MFVEESSPPIQNKWAENKLNRWRFLKKFSTDEDMRITVEDTMFHSTFNALKRIIKDTRNYVDKFDFYEKLIHRTVPRYYVSDIVEKITYLLDLGTDVNAINPLSGFSIIHNVCDVCYSAEVRYRIQLIQELLNRNVDINSRDKKGFTPLYYAVKRMNYPIMKFLLEKGADINARTTYKKTLLFEFTNYFIKNHEKYYIEIDKYKEMIKFLIKNGADINAYCNCDCGSDGCTYTLLHDLCSHVMQNKNNQDDIDKNNIVTTMISTLIKNGANVNATVIIDDEVNTPLSIAVYNGNISIVETLLVYEPFISNHVLDYLEKSQDEDNKRIAEMIDNHITILQEQPMRKRRRLC